MAAITSEANKVSQFINPFKEAINKEAINKVSTATTVGSSHQSQHVNINPKAEDCYFYFYSTCSKVYVFIFYCLLSPLILIFSVFLSLSLSHPFPLRVTNVSLDIVQLLLEMKKFVNFGKMESVNEWSVLLDIRPLAGEYF